MNAKETNQSQDIAGDIEVQAALEMAEAAARPPQRLETCIFVARNQRDVNAKMAGEDWMERGSKHGEVDYTMAALDECHELWTCALNFKWWDRKSFVGDARNARMEQVDLLHFITSEDLITYFSQSDAWGPDEAERAVGVVGRSMYEAAERCIGNVKGQSVPWELYLQFKRELKDFIRGLTSHSVDWGAFWGMVVTVDDEAWKDPEAAVNHILDLYSAKACLNLFRTVHRNGSNGYRKVWVDGREDNDIMMAWLESQPVYPGNAAVTHWLEEQYARIIAVR